MDFVNQSELTMYYDLLRQRWGGQGCVCSKVCALRVGPLTAFLQALGPSSIFFHYTFFVCYMHLF